MTRAAAENGGEILPVDRRAELRRRDPPPHAGVRRDGQLGVPDPVGQHLLVLARGQEGYRLLAQQITKAQLVGHEKGRPVYDLDDLGKALGNDGEGFAARRRRRLVE